MDLQTELSNSTSSKHCHQSVCVFLAKIVKSFLQFYLDVGYLLVQAEEKIAISYIAKDMIFKVFGNRTMGILANTEFSIASVVTFPT